MTRIATSTLYARQLADIQRQQVSIADAQREVSSGRKASSYQALGADVGRSVATRTLLSRETAYGDAATRTAGTLALQDSHLGALHSQLQSLRTVLTDALAADEAHGLDTALEAAFDTLRATLNASEAGTPLFSGGVRDTPAFTPTSLGVLAALPDTAQAFANDQIRARARIGEGQEVTSGLLADEIGASSAAALAALANAGIGDGPLSAGARAAITTAIAALETAAGDVADVQAANGALQASVEAASAASAERRTYLETALGGIEDADLTAAIARLQQEQAALQTSYEVFSRLSQLNLLAYL